MGIKIRSYHTITRKTIRLKFFDSHLSNDYLVEGHLYIRRMYSR